MRRLGRSSLLAFGIASLIVIALPASAHHEGDRRTRNLRPRGDTDDNRRVTGFTEAFFTDVAFRGQTAIQGTWSGGFRTIDISSPRHPDVLTEVKCGEFQGDVGVYGKLIFRSIDTPVAATTVEETCTAPVSSSGGFEGLQIFEVENFKSASADDIVAAVGTDCGSHTHTVVPDPDNNRVLIYVSNSNVSPTYSETVFGNSCDGVHEKIVIVEVPLGAPEDAAVINEVPITGMGQCHDIGALMNGDQQLAVCAAHEALVFDISDPDDPKFVTSFTDHRVALWHSAALSWDGDVTVMGWEPGGGVAPECEASDPDFFKSIFFFDTDTGELLGTWVLPRPQSAVQNCTIHNYNIVPLKRRDVLVAGNYQAGTWVVHFSNPARAKTVAWSDPAPVDPNELTLGGAWGSYWYNDFIYETNITEGLNIFKLKDKRVAGALRMPFLNPQTQLGPVDR